MYLNTYVDDMHGYYYIPILLSFIFKSRMAFGKVDLSSL